MGKRAERFTITRNSPDFHGDYRWTVWDDQTITRMGTFDTRQQAESHRRKCRAELKRLADIEKHGDPRTPEFGVGF